MSKMKSQFLTGLVLVILLLSLGVARVAVAETLVNDRDSFLTALDNPPSDNTINLGSSTITIRKVDSANDPIEFIPQSIDNRVITITSTNTTTINYGTPKAEDDGVEYYFTIGDSGGITFSKAANLSGGYSSTGLFFVTDGKLTFDKAATLHDNKSTSRGGAIYAESSSDKPILTFKEDTTFTGNYVEGEGGAIGLLDGTITIAGSATFTSNTAEGEGGALWLTNDSTLLISGISNFSKNSTTQNGGGGAIFATGGSLTFGSAFTAEGNTSYSDGGALNLSNSATVTFNGTATFKKNKAGYDPADPTTPASGSGGAMYVTGGTIDFHDTATFGGDATADGNIATTAGGALYIDSNAGINFVKDAKFQNNSVSAGDGGAIYLDSGTINFNAGATFESNKSIVGSYGGGAIYAIGDTTSLIFSGTTKFLNNTADNTDPNIGGNGGAVYLNMVSGNMSDSSNPIYGFDAQGTMEFSGNMGIQGGAIYSYDSKMQFQEITLTGNTATFENPNPDEPTSDSGGGALYADSSYIVFNGTTTVTKNKASKGSGGAFFVKSGGTVDVDSSDYSLVFKGLTTISENEEAKNGGAFFLDATSVSFEGTKTTITKNKAENGGAFWLHDSMVSFSGDVEIAENTATGKGGAFYVAPSSQSIIRVGNNSKLDINEANGNAKNDIYLAEESVLEFHTGTNSTLTIASDISSASASEGTTEIIKTGEGFVYIDGDASKFVGNLTIRGGDFHIGKEGTFGNIDSTALNVEAEGQLVLVVGDSAKSESPGDARIFVSEMTLEDGGEGPRIMVKALNDSPENNSIKYAFIKIQGDRKDDLDGYTNPDDGRIGSFNFLDFHSETEVDSTNDTTTLYVWLTYDPDKHDGNFELPRKTDEFTLQYQQLKSSNQLTVSGKGKLILKNENTVAGLNGGGNLDLQNNLTVAGSADASFSGNVTGTGKLIVNGDLTQTLTGNNSYSGGTDVSKGTLVGNSNSLKGDIKIDQLGNLTFDQTQVTDPQGIFGGRLSGNGTLNIEGKTIEKGAQEDSVLRFTNNSSGFTGATNIKSGWLLLAKEGNQSGDLSNSDISVSEHGGLGGAGTVKNVTVAPGGAIQAFEGTLKINGNLEYTSGGILYVIVDGNTPNVIDVAGTAKVDNVTVDVVGVKNYKEGDPFKFLTAGEIEGTFKNTSDTVKDESGKDWEFTFAKNGNDYTTVGKSSDTPGPDPPTPPPAPTPGLVWNQAEVARTLNTVGEGLTGFPQFIKELNAHKTTDADGNIEYDTIYRDITKQLSGSVRLNGLQLSLYSPYRTVFNRLTLGSELYSGSPIIYNNGSGGYAPISGLEHRGAGAGATTYRGQYEPLNSHLLDEAATCQVPYFMGENNFWADVTHVQTKVKSDGNSDGYGISRTGLLIGMDIQRKPTSRIGVLFGYFAPYLWQNADRVEADDYHTALYFQKNYYGTDIYGFLGYAHQEYNSQRFINVTTLDPKYGVDRYSGKTSGDNFSMSFELSKPRYYGNNYILRPLIGLDYIFAAQNGYLDYGTASNLFGLRYDRAEYDQWFIRAGLNLKRETFRSAMNFRLQYINQFGSHPYPSAGGQLISAYSTPNTNMNIRGVNLGRDYVNLGFGLNWFVNESRSRFISFDYDFNTSKRITSHGFSLIFIEHF
ncbi:MAG: autotransporter domain-containing protein [Planctomycetaceae bacterium]|nr:autotransporter domain-containing protein [Planctomycetaceae bacterium]